MSVACAADLTNETWSNVLSYTSLHDLAAASLVSRTWQALAFPHLYHTVYLTYNTHLESLAKRIASDQDGPLSLRNYIRGLVIDKNIRRESECSGGFITEEDYHRLIDMLPQLSQLGHFSWEKAEILRDSGVIDTLQTGCPNLKSIHWYISGYIGNPLEQYYDDYVRMLAFKKLWHFSLHVRDIPIDYDEYYGDPIAGLVRASPDLKTLDLNLQGSSEYGFQWPLDELLAAIATDTCTSLSTFRAVGSITPNWDNLFDSPESSPVYKFFSHHPKLHTVGLGWIDEDQYYGDIKLNFMEVLFPSLKHVEAPSFFCVPILASTLANTIESLTMPDDPFDPDRPELWAIAEQAAPLPNLRKLELQGARNEAIAVAPLKKLLSKAPGLEELELRLPLDEPCLPEVLRLVPNLSTLTISTEVLESFQDAHGISEWRGCIPVIARMCGNLRCVNNVEYEDHWIIKREGDGRV